MPGCTELTRTPSPNDGAFHRDRLCKQPHAALGRAIAGERLRAAQARQRRHHDDRAAAALAHRRQRVLDRKEDAVELIAVCRRQSSSVISTIDGDPDADAGIGDEDVEPAVALHDLGHHLDPARLAGDVLMQEHRLAAGLLDSCDEFGPSSSSMSVTATFAPSRASNSQTAAPMPDAPPVTSATFPCNLSCHFHSRLLLSFLTGSPPAPDRARRHRSPAIARVRCPANGPPRAIPRHAMAGRDSASARCRAFARSSGTRCR